VKRPARLFVAFVNETGRQSGGFHADYCRGRPLCVHTTERNCRAEVRDGWAGMPPGCYEIVTYVPLTETRPEGK
jgi:hypothetical protein